MLMLQGEQCVLEDTSPIRWSQIRHKELGACYPSSVGQALSAMEHHMKICHLLDFYPSEALRSA